MANISFNQITSGSDNDFKVGYFSLKNDGDEAIVRIMHDSVESFDLVTTHPIQLGGRYLKVNCLRNPTDPLNYCPLCNAGSKIQQRFYIHLIQYVKDDQGNIVGQPKVWERSASYAVTIKDLINEYGPLSNCIFKIRRSGAAGSMDTKYSIMYGNPQVYREEMYKKDESAFEGYHSVGTAVMDKNFDDMSVFVSTGSFPETNKNKNASNQEDVPFNVGGNNSSVNYNSQPVSQTNVPNYHPASQTIPNNNGTTAPNIQRPTRYY